MATSDKGSYPSTATYPSLSPIYRHRPVDGSAWGSSLTPPAFRRGRAQGQAHARWNLVHLVSA